MNDVNICDEFKKNWKPSQEDYEGRKRAIDFGLGRGYSGSQVEKDGRNTKYVLKRKQKKSLKKSFFSPFSCDKYFLQAARHMAGIMQANFSGGPGK